MKFIRAHKKVAVSSLALVVAIMAGGAAYAYFTSTGSGTGSAQTGTATNVTISQVGAGYDSLIPSMVYGQDQCFSCAGVTELGNDVTLAGSGDQQLTSVVLAVRNWGAEIPSASITLSINNTVAGPVTFTQAFDVPAATDASNGIPSTTDLTFNVASQGIFVQHEFVYGFTFGDPEGAESSLNIALSDSATNVSVGSDTTNGTIYISGGTASNDFPTCMTDLPTSSFQQVTTDCGPSNGGNPGAYGYVDQTTGNIPAVEFNVVGGTTPPLYPGGPSEPINFAITNPGSSSVYVNSVTTSVTGVTGGQNNALCDPTWYSIGYPTPTVGEAIPPGTTVFSNTGTTISMTDSGTNQDACEGATVNIGFTSN